MKYTIGWESNGKKVPILWGKSDYEFPKYMMGVAAFSSTMRNWWGKTCIFHMMKIYQTMGVGWEKSTHTMGKACLPISQDFSAYDGFCCFFPYYDGKLMGKPMHFIYDEYTIGWESDEKKLPILWEKYL